MTDSLEDVRSFIHPSTIVYTRRGPKEICDVCPGDEVVAQTGTFVAVAIVHRKPYRGLLLDIGGRGQVHEHHRLMQADDAFVQADELRPGDVLRGIVPRYTEDIPELTEEDCLLYGVMMVSARVDKDNVVTLRHNMLTSAAEETLKAGGVNFLHDQGAGTLVFMSPFRREMLLDESWRMRFYAPLLHLPQTKLRKLQQGLWYGSMASSDPADGDRCIAVSDRALAEAIRYIFLRTGTDLEYDGEILRKPPGPIAEGSTGYVDRKIRSIDREEFSGELVDLETAGECDEERTYMTNVGASHNGGGKRNGSFAIYIEPWHADVFDFLDLKKNHGDEERRARDLFYAMWVPDLFMERVQSGSQWSLMDPSACPGLPDAVGQDFKLLYEGYEASSRWVRQVDARTLWNAILVSQIETGTPYLLFKDACNRKSNQSNLGTIRSSNLCSEILQYSSPAETAVCNLSSIALPTFARAEDWSFDFEGLHNVTKVAMRNLNKVIDINYYPTPEAELSNRRHRPVGIGVQGLADTFCILRHPFESPEARQLNRDIAETMYHAALETSCELAAEREAEILEYRQLASIEGKSKEIKRQINHILKRTRFTKEELERRYCPGAYDSYFWNGGCPVSKGILQFDMWDVRPSDRYDWDALRGNIEIHGVRNSLMIAIMPTASTSQILGNSECIEPVTANVYSRRTIAGDFMVVNKYLMRELIDSGKWNEQMKQRILAAEGSVQGIEEIPEEVRRIYKTVWEIPQRALIDLSADRGTFTCQTQAPNMFVGNPTPKVLTSMHFHSFKSGLKTASYYMRCQLKAKIQQFTVDPALAKVEKAAKADSAALACSRDNAEGCLACSA